MELLVFHLQERKKKKEKKRKLEHQHGGTCL
jgi:hypothetical protein